ncbi:hypothetical protein HMPREF9630_00749 [Peptoanaerobacter stomatis]|uniref:N-acetyltransferase domain-containing protein n=1 Tax=Peptoanaerobacter stomatis TaxID=796937 RepID=V9HPL4_9FIRM|nr:GNAT family N-acetyltransferase [Peptoanaerobacter stomatis]EHL15380.1 hypothetical protein HMPREF9630_00749 [Peptoanaerobacter stomatis]
MIIYRDIKVEEHKILTDMIKKLSDESNYYPFTSSDYNVSDEEQINFINRLNMNDNCYLSGAFDDEKLAGLIYLYGGNRVRNYHSCTLGIGVLSSYKNQKIGSNLMQRAIDYAYECDVIGKINVQVVKENTNAINFYKKFEFVIEGIEKRSLFIDGKFYDAVNMGRII